MFDQGHVDEGARADAFQGLDRRRGARIRSSIDADDGVVAFQVVDVTAEVSKLERPGEARHARRGPGPGEGDRLPCRVDRAVAGALHRQRMADDFRGDARHLGGIVEIAQPIAEFEERRAPRFLQLSIGDVDGYAGKTQRLAALVADDASLGEKPARASVGLNDPVLAPERPAVRQDPVQLALEDGQVVGVEVLDEVRDRRSFDGLRRVDRVDAREIRIGVDTIGAHVPVPDADDPRRSESHVEPRFADNELLLCRQTALLGGGKSLPQTRRIELVGSLSSGGRLDRSVMDDTCWSGTWGSRLEALPILPFAPFSEEQSRCHPIGSMRLRCFVVCQRPRGNVSRDTGRGRAA